jgi:hypothetical protein
MFNALNHNTFQSSGKLPKGEMGDFMGKVLLAAAFLAVYGLLIWLIWETVAGKMRFTWIP